MLARIPVIPLLSASALSIKPSASKFLRSVNSFGGSDGLSTSHAIQMLCGSGYLQLIRAFPNALHPHHELLPPLKKTISMSSPSFSFMRPFSTRSPPLHTSLDVSKALAAQFEEYKISYAIGGALSQNQYGEVRTTADVDINIGVLIGQSKNESDTLFRILESFGCSNSNETDSGPTKTWSRELLIHQYNNKGFICVYIPTHVYGFMKLELFPPYLPIQQLIMGDSRCIKSFKIDDNSSANFLSVEAIIALKLFFYRPKDRTDIEGILRKMKIKGEVLDENLFNSLMSKLQDSSANENDEDRAGIVPNKTVEDKLEWFRYTQSMY
jgi:hypothetical protein